MHELGIVFHIAKKVESIAVENHVSHVAKVVLEIGEVSTVVPSYLEDCWKWKCTKSDILKDCALEIEMIPAVTFCEDCEKTYGTVEHGKTCPYCGSEHTYLVQGMNIRSRRSLFMKRTAMTMSTKRQKTMP